MPNWCEGFLKIRGSMQNIKKFLLEGLIAYSFDYKNLTEIALKDGTSLVDEWDEEIDIQINRQCHITGTRRAFADEKLVAIMKYEGRDSIVSINVKQAWDMLADEFAAISKKYDVDFRLFGFEQGQQFSRDIIIEKGIVKKNETQEYDNWIWDCPCSDFGG